MKQNDSLPPDSLAVDQETEQAVAALRGQAVTVTSGEMDATMLVLESRGAMQQAQFIETVSRTSMLARLAHIKESKGYKGAHVRDTGGNIVTVKTWDDYCKALGMSRAKVDEDLANLATFGGNLLKMQDALGIGYRDLRKMRANMAALPENAQEAIRAEIEQASDKEELLAALDEMGARNARLAAEKKEMEKQLATNDRLLKEAREKEYRTRQEMDRALNPTTPDEAAQAAEEQMNRVRHGMTNACLDLEKAGATLAGIMARLLNTEEGRARLTEEQHTALVFECNERLGQCVARVADALLTAGADVDMAAAMQAIHLDAEPGQAEA